MKLPFKIISMVLILITGVAVYMLVHELVEIRGLAADFNSQYAELINIEEQEKNLSLYIYIVTGGLVSALISLLLLKLGKESIDVEDRLINVDDEVEEDGSANREANAEVYFEEMEVFANKILDSGNQYQQILSKIAKDFNVVAGAIYLTNTDNSKVELITSYAHKISEEHRVFKWGDGLVGQVAKSNELMAISELPEMEVEIDLTVESGLGQSSPKALLLLPFGVGKEVSGVIELGFFKMPDKNDMMKLERGMNVLGNLSNKASISAQK